MLENKYNKYIHVDDDGLEYSNRFT